MTDHLTPEQFENYRHRESSRESVEIDRHIAECEACRKALPDFELAQEFFSDLLEVERIEFAHPAYEMFSAYVDGKSSARDKWNIEGHLVLCGSCRDQLEDLQEFARQMKKQPREKPAGLWDRLSTKLSEALRPPAFAPVMGALDQEASPPRGTIVRVVTKESTAFFRSEEFDAISVGDVFDIFRPNEDPLRVPSAEPFARLIVDSLAKQERTIGGHYEGDTPVEGDILYLRRGASVHRQGEDG